MPASKSPVTGPVRVSELQSMVAYASAINEAHGRIEILLQFLDPDTAAKSSAHRHLQTKSDRSVVAFQAIGVRLLIPGRALNPAIVGHAGVEVVEVDSEQAVVEIRARIAVRHDHAE